MSEYMWQKLYETLAHGDELHRAWLRGVLAGWASAAQSQTIQIKEVGK